MNDKLGRVLKVRVLSEVQSWPKRAKKIRNVRVIGLGTEV
jgi:hypothetical protein